MGNFVKADGRTLTGDRCQCAECGLLFNSTSAFEKHRTGEFTPNTRRCLGVEEMAEKGMAINKQGFWITKPMSVIAMKARNAETRDPWDLADKKVKV